MRLARHRYVQRRLFMGDVVSVSSDHMLSVLRWMRDDCFARPIVYGLSGAQLSSMTAFPILTVIGVIGARSHFTIGMGTHTDEMCLQLLGSTSARCRPVTSAFTAVVSPWITSTCVVTVWDVNRGCTHHGKFIFYLIGSLETIGSDPAPVMIGITFTLITVRIGQGVETRVVEHAFGDAVGLLGD